MLDEKDKVLLRLIQDDCSISMRSLGERIGLTQTPCRERLLRLTEMGYILRQVTLLNRMKLDLRMTGFVIIKMFEHDLEKEERMIATLAKMPDVIRLYRTAGEFDYILQVVAADTEAFSSALARIRMQAGSFCIFTTTMAIEEIKNTTRLPLHFE
ncbi:Lrp/AsnC family transcriptional regulator [Enterobacter ludwigii]|uniref:Lrp/AsnC family transcriptional regulator n=1 Tax=Enterobacter ludwigii TaxID=299767 RepID=UPI00159C8646|nr:Lrp/AsnC family transcriptional regulator [Enterobacter ludwigii]QLA06277.1 Lrp/AsnC family transcriptional regulator [Enterobacter ludwigii]